MFKVKKNNYLCIFNNENIEYDLENNNKIELVVNGSFQKDLLSNEYLLGKDLKLLKIKYKNIDLAITKESEKEILNLIIQDISDISEIDIDVFDYDLEFNNGKNIQNILDKYIQL